MTVTVRETKSVTVQTTVSALTVGSIESFMRECREAKLPADTCIFITHFTEAATPHYKIRAERINETDNLPREATP